MKRMWARAVFVGAMGLVAGGSLGCAEERAPVNRVQANALSKSFFVGENLQDPADDPEFWERPMVVDVGYGASQDSIFNSSWAMADLTRIKWVIQEDLLLGRITYERIEETDHKGVGKESTDGVIAVAFAITSHFDIKRAYNPTTGEESNLIEENMSDRPWYEREYMRVDFSRNLATDSYDFDTLSLMGVYGGVKYEPLAYYVNDPASPDAPQFDPEAGYFDVTTKAFATPQLIDLSSFGWGIDAFPACFLDNDFMHGSAPAGNCNPVEITVRHSFRKVEDHDYEPMDWDGLRFQAYGPFTNDRYGYARNYGMSDDKWHRFINRYQIWERSHAYLDPETMTGAVPCYTPETTPLGADPRRDENGDGTDDECQILESEPIAYGRNVDLDNDPATPPTWIPTGPGSRCDIYKQKCTLPYQQRVPKPLQWYYTQGSNPEYFDGTEWATHEWDVAMRSAVMVAKYGECMRVGAPVGLDGSSGDCAALYPVYTGQMDDNSDAIWLAREIDDCRNKKSHLDAPDCLALADQLGSERKMSTGVVALAKMPEMIVLCHSPVSDTDPESCGKRGMIVRMGDLRYHNVNAFTAPQTPSSWGIYTDSEDPLTGEKISSGINVWTHVNDLWSQNVIDVARFIKGELKIGDITEGTFVHDWVQANGSAQRNEGIAPPMTRKQVNDKLADFIGVDRKEFDKMDSAKGHPKDLDPATKQLGKKAMDMVREARADVRGPSANRAVYAARRAAARGTPMEAELMTKAMQQYAGVETLPLTDEVLDASSPLRGMNPDFRREFERTKDALLAEKGSCIIGEETAAPAPLALHGLADLLEEKFEKFNAEDPIDVQLKRAEKMRRWLAQRVHYAVIIHEMGHSIGMRHNFLSSADAFSYRPQYWQLRTKNGKLKDQCVELSKDGEDCVGPRYFDPVTEDERKGLLWMWSQSSVMDYAGDHMQDTIGLGAYDFAAARMFYGEMVSVFSDKTYKKGQPRATGVLDRLDSFGGIIGLNYVLGGTPIHYSQLDSAYQLIDPKSCEEVDAASFKPANWNEERDGKWHELLDGLLVKVDGKYTKCRQQQVDYVPWQSLEAVTPVYYRKDIHAYDKKGRIRVPYPFATDSWADLGNLSVYRHDNGADPYELASYWIAQQELNHVFDNYRRHRQSFSVRAAADRTLNRYSVKMRDAAKGLGLLRNIAYDIGVDNGGDPNAQWLAWAKDPAVRDVILMSGMVFDHFSRQLARPAPSVHVKAGGGDPVLRSGDLDSNYSGSPKVLIPNGVYGGRDADGGYAAVGLGGRLLENRLSDTNGEYDRDFTQNAGCYYDKVNVGYLMTESEDNFISDSRTDFLDSRYRAVSLADLFPEGWRRWVANNLTGDDAIKGPRLIANAAGDPEVDPEISLTPQEAEVANCDPNHPQCRYPKSPIGWTSWWPVTGPEVCFPAKGIMACNRYAQGTGEFDPESPANTVTIDPQVGWEQQKWLIAQTMMYLPENQQQRWADMLALYELGQDNDPQFSNRIEFHNPLGKVYVAKTFGKEDIFGHVVQKGIAARVLEWANQLLFKAYQTDPVDFDADGVVDWYLPKTNALTGEPTVLNKAAAEKLERYMEVLWFLSRSPFWLNLEIKGIYD